MFSTGMNGFINAQGFPKTGMCTIAIGAVLNLVLDPIFIFVFDMGVAGAAIATVISQAVLRPLGSYVFSWESVPCTTSARPI